MSETDRAAVEISTDRDVKAVLEFMQRNIPASKLVGIAEVLPGMARLLWGQYPQEPFSAISLKADLSVFSTTCEKPLAATV